MILTFTWADDDNNANGIDTSLITTGAADSNCAWTGANPVGGTFFRPSEAANWTASITNTTPYGDGTTDTETIEFISTDPETLTGLSGE